MLLLSVLAALAVLLALLAALAAVAVLVLPLESLLEAVLPELAFALPLLLLAPPVVTVNLLQSSWAPRCASYDAVVSRRKLMTTWNLIDLPAW